MPDSCPSRQRQRTLIVVLACVLLAGAVGAVLLSNGSRHASPATPTTSTSGPPWLYGSSDARYLLVVYADLECPFCQAYIPQLRQIVDTTEGVALQWHHLPLEAHEPVTSHEARMVECQGEAGGAPAFWTAVAWVYAHTRGDGKGPIDGAEPPGLDATVRACLSSERPAAIVRRQAANARAEGISATPTVRLHDRTTGRTLKLAGPIEGDALLSALDWLSQPEGNEPESSTEF